MLLQMAREAIASDLFGTPPSDRLTVSSDLPCSGVFVTLRRQGRLRGCIGTFESSSDLARTIRTMAVSAAHDPRFIEMPIGADEISRLEIEISVLSPLKKISDPLDFELGRHGIYIRRGYASGCFLPDVATEHGWSREVFLSECCSHKAGLEPTAWKDPTTEIFVFTAEKFSSGA